MHDEELEGAEQPIVDDDEIEADAWAAAFEAVEKKNQKEPEHNDGDGEDAAPADGNAENSDEAGNHGAGDDGDAGSVPALSYCSSADVPSDRTKSRSQEAEDRNPQGS